MDEIVRCYGCLLSEQDPDMVDPCKKTTIVLRRKGSNIAWCRHCFNMANAVFQCKQNLTGVQVWIGRAALHRHNFSHLFDGLRFDQRGGNFQVPREVGVGTYDRFFFV